MRNLQSLVFIMLIAASCGQSPKKSQSSVSYAAEMPEEMVAPQEEVASEPVQEPSAEITIKDSLVRHYIETNLADFPKDFKSYYAKFGDIDSPDYYSYDESPSESIYNSSLPKDLVCSKLVAVCIGGKWDADEINFLSDVMHSMATEYPSVLASVLSKYSVSEQTSFWSFCFDSPYPSNYKDVYEAMLSKDELKPFRDQIKTVYKQQCDREASTIR